VTLSKRLLIIRSVTPVTGATTGYRFFGIQSSLPKVETFGTTGIKSQSKGDIHLMESQKKGVERQDQLKVSIFSAQIK